MANQSWMCGRVHDEHGMGMNEDLLLLLLGLGSQVRREKAMEGLMGRQAGEGKQQEEEEGKDGEWRSQPTEPLASMY